MSYDYKGNLFRPLQTSALEHGRFSDSPRRRGKKWRNSVNCCGVRRTGRVDQFLVGTHSSPNGEYDLPDARGLCAIWAKAGQTNMTLKQADPFQR
jgi:hypothetical protein